MAAEERNEARSSALRPYKIVGETYGGETWKQYRSRCCGCIYITDADVSTYEVIWCSLHKCEG